MFLGEDEIAHGTVTLKDLVSGEQVTVSPKDAIARVLDALANRAEGKPIREKRMD
jgi:histidyl-tRNA synthetase